MKLSEKVDKEIYRIINDNYLTLDVFDKQSVISKVLLDIKYNFYNFNGFSITKTDNKNINFHIIIGTLKIKFEYNVLDILRYNKIKKIKCEYYIT